jgi:His/Glu/Gln/Arg/opine family amino acid ABC transporter permease subunit
MSASMELLVESAPLLLRGAAATLQIWVTAVLISMTVGVCWGILSSRRTWVSVLSSIVSVFTFVLRGVPFYVQLLIVYYVLPDFLGMNFSSFVSGTISLGFCSAGYIAQITRSGINSLPEGQWDASYVLGYSKFHVLKSIIIPQMLRNVAPAIAGEFDQLLKSTSILATIGFLELTRVGMNIIAQEMVPMTIYLSIAGIYLVMSLVLNIITRKTEQYLNIV